MVFFFWLLTSLSKLVYQFLHVAGSWLGRIDPSRLLAPGHPPSVLVVPLQDGLLSLTAQLPEDCLAGAGGRGARVETHRVPSRHLTVVGIADIAGTAGTGDRALRHTREI